MQQVVSSQEHADMAVIWVKNWSHNYAEWVSISAVGLDATVFQKQVNLSYLPDQQVWKVYTWQCTILWSKTEKETTRGLINGSEISEKKWAESAQEPWFCSSCSIQLKRTGRENKYKQARRGAGEWGAASQNQGWLVGLSHPWRAGWEVAIELQELCLAERPGCENVAREGRELFQRWTN